MDRLESCGQSAILGAGYNLWTDYNLLAPPESCREAAVLGTDNCLVDGLQSWGQVRVL